jgi:putative transposase
MNEDRRREIGLFWYALVRDAADPALSKAERGRLVRALAEREHVGPDGRLVGVARGTLDRWIRSYRDGGFEALVPRTRLVAPRTAAELLELAFQIKRERPERTAAQVREIMLAAAGDQPVPGLRTLQTHLAREGLNVRADGRMPGKVYGRFEASARNELWTGDGLHGPSSPAPQPGGRCCWRSSMITRGCWSAGDGAPARTCSGWKPRSAQG